MRPKVQGDRKALVAPAGAKSHLYSAGRLIEGLSIENPTELSNLICKELSKGQK